MCRGTKIGAKDRSSSDDICLAFKYSNHSKEKGNVMSASSSYPRVVLSRRVLIIGAMVVVISALTAVYIWIATAQLIAPPGLRVMSWFWSVFVCRCL